MSMPRTALTHGTQAHVSKDDRNAHLSVTRVQIVPECSSRADHIVTAPSAYHPKIQTGASEKCASLFTVAAAPKTARFGGKG
ncbi:hypothetical protein C7455_11237 [Roseicyclus mahoneyensis]|uniref:Uncharacterized protein n=1 Tax=Roseicyclus mahoneyensis TaxID=164332 RepID=A0A316G8L1_9RHOB|nr:hypothetical protein C7455_11237 [Roseicyclus mahoneyensis]